MGRGSGRSEEARRRLAAARSLVEETGYCRQVPDLEYLDGLVDAGAART